MEPATELVPVAAISLASRSAKGLSAAGTCQRTGLVLTRTVDALMSPKNR